MEVLVILTCLGILLQFNGLLCNKQEGDCESVSDARFKRNHEADNEKPIVKPILNLLKPAPVKKVKLTKQKGSKNTTNLNHILKEIASLANKRNETRDIDKIRHLVDEIDNKNKKNAPKVSVINVDENGKNASTSNKNPVKTKVVVVNQQKNTTKTAEASDKLPELGKVNSKTPSDDIAPKEIEEVDERRSNIEICENNHQNLNINDLKKQNAKDALIEIKEHAYEEELLHASCVPANTYNNLYSGGNYYRSYLKYFNRKGNNFGYSNNDPLYYPNSNEYINYNYPRITYGSYYNTNGYNYDMFNKNTQKANGWQRNGDIKGIRKSWLDRNTIIRPNAPYRYRLNVNEDRKVITNIQSPDYKYYSVMQKLYPGGARRNQNSYYNDPCHCS